MITMNQVGINEWIIQRHETIFILVMSILYYHILCLQKFYQRYMKYVFFSVKLIINVYTKKASFMHLLSRVTINFYTRLALSLLSSKYHVVGPFYIER